MSDEAAKETGPRLDEEVIERRNAALAQVVQYGDPVLKSPASPVSEFGASLRRDAERMVSIMADALGVGLAATQVGILRRLLVFQAGPYAEPTAIVNPEVEWLSDEVAVAEEGCLSIPRISVDVERPLFARISGNDVEGSPLVLEASGLEARVLQHEIDHLDGVLILDRTDREQRRGALRALRDGGTYSPADDGEPSEEADTGSAGQTATQA